MVKNRIEILVIYPVDPNGNKVGGINTYIKNFIKYLPDNYFLELIGISSDQKKCTIGKWKKIQLNRKEFDFLPVLFVEDENKKYWIPLIIRFILSLFRYKKRISFRNKILVFHRVEPILLFRNLKNKKVLIIHGNMQNIYNPKSEIKWSKLPFIYFKLEKFLISKVNKIYMVSENGVNFYKKRYPKLKNRISFLPTWVDDVIFNPMSLNIRSNKKKKILQSLGFHYDSILVLFAGRLEMQKDPFLLIEVFKYLNRKIPQSKLLIVGSGSLKNKILKKIKKYNLQETTFLFGAVNQKILSNIMKVSDIFLLTSAFEGMPRSVLEALACGLPIVTTDVGEVNKVVRNNVSGFISEDRDPEIICDLIIRVLKHEEIFKIENCVDSIKNYTARIILDRIYRDYERL